MRPVRNKVEEFCRGQPRATPGWIARYASKASADVLAGVKPNSRFSASFASTGRYRRKPTCSGPWTVSRSIRPTREAEREHTRRHRQQRLAEPSRDLAHRHPAVAGDVVDAGRSVGRGAGHRGRDVVDPDEDERRLRAADGQDPAPVPQRRDLVLHGRAEDRADTEHDLLQTRDAMSRYEASISSTSRLCFE